MKLTLIAAMARQRVIGQDNQLLWHLPEDMKFFKAQTQGHPVIMGRKTWDSLPERFRPLPGRPNIVVTRNPAWQAAGAQAVTSLGAALAAAAPSPQVFVIGGGELYAAALAQADELLLTEIHHDFPGDTRFPQWPPGAFTEVRRERHHAAPPNAFDFDFVTYRATR